MRSFKKNSKGAVTVFVTLLLIPSILVSGTAVDMARISTARSVLQDANQLAGNSVLTQYNALLYDIYGLFGVSEEDPVLWEMLNNYVSVSVFGEPSQDRSLGTLQLFYGAGLSMEEVLFAEDKDLNNIDVLRRQIEEYMKYRGPVLIVTEFLDALDDNTIKKDTEVIQDKLSIDSGIAEMYEKYKELYDAIVTADKCTMAVGGAGGGYFGSVSTILGNIRDDFVTLRSTYIKWRDAGCANEAAEHAKHYEGLLENIAIRVTGGRLYQNWREGRRDAYGIWVSGSGWETRGGTIVGLNRTIENTIAKAEEFKANFDKVVKIAREIDVLRDKLADTLDKMERKLKSGEANAELAEAFLVKKEGTPPMTLVERYRSILKWGNIEGMATAYKNAGYDYIDQVFKPMLEGVKYRNRNNESAGSLTRDELVGLLLNPSFSISGSSADIMTERFSAFPSSSVNYAYPPGFLQFSQVTARHREFFAELTAMMNQPPLDPVKLFDGQEDEGGADAQEKQENIIDALLKLVDTAYEGMTNQPLGARYIHDSETPEAKDLGIFEIVALITQSLGDNVIGVMQDPAGSMMNAWEYMLLLTYCTSVFSN